MTRFGDASYGVQQTACFIIYAVYMSVNASLFRPDNCERHTFTPPPITVYCRLRLKCDGTRAETIFLVFRRNGRVHLNRREASVQSTTGSWGVRISGSNAGYTMFRDSVKSTDHPLHSPVSLSLPLPCVTVCHHISTGLYLVCPDVLRVVGETSYGIRVGFNGSDKVLTIYLFIYLFVSEARSLHLSSYSNKNHILTNGKTHIFKTKVRKV